VSIKSNDQKVVEAMEKKIGTVKNSVYDTDGTLIRLEIDNFDSPQLPSEIGLLVNLQELILGTVSRLNALRPRNHLLLTQLPPEIGLLKNLRTFYLSYSQITELPPEFSLLINLRELSLIGNQLNQFPTQIHKLTNLKKLIVPDNHISYLPAEICRLTSLEELILGVDNGPGSQKHRTNHLTQLPPEIGQLTNLHVLYLDYNNITQLPPEIGQLTSLQSFHLSHNPLIQLPSEFVQLIGLQELFLTAVGLREFPREILSMVSLRSLIMHNNSLTQLPPEIGQLTNLRGLYVTSNCLTQLPPEIGQLTNLRELLLRNNPLTQLPPEIGQLTNLQRLELDGTALTQLPPEIGNLDNLESIQLNNIPHLLTPPSEIVARGIKDIRVYLQELQKDSIRRFEAKLLLVGEGGTGKSSLLKTLRNADFDLHSSTTHGIEIDQLYLQHPQQSNIMMLLNTWDFGGQHIYHATHQFFLTKRSLYLVVWNARLGAEQGRLNYWLSTIQALAPDSPVLLVATHADERVPDFNYQLYKDAYRQLVGSLSVSNKYGTGIEKLKEILAIHAATLPLIGQLWPTNWVEVEKALMVRKEHHIDANRYTRICAVRRIQAKIAQGTLATYLHDLGKILYFRDDYVLCHLVVLKPNWVTKTISRVLEDNIVREAYGILAHSELSRIWATDEEGHSYEPYLYPVFLRLMERFDLSYQLDPGVPNEYPTHSLIPQLLPHQPPTDLPDWPKKPELGQAHLQMIYRFEFVPAGIMSWFIVRTHRYTLGKHWREGVLLSYQKHYAKIELNPMTRELRLAVWGIQPHNFFSILKDTLDLILNRFEGLYIRREVPCICHWQIESEKICQEVYRYEEDLVRRIEVDKQTVECPASYVAVSVPELLYGIHVSTTPQVIAMVAAGQQEILRRLMAFQQRDEVLIQQIKQLCEWSVRHFTRQWNLEMCKMEAECPNTFILIPGSRAPYDLSNWINHPHKLLLLCQSPSGPHRVDENYAYDLHQPKEWWIKVAPWLRYIITFLKYGVPLVGAAGAVFDTIYFKDIEAQVGLLEKIVEDLPKIVESDQKSIERKSHDMNREQVTIAPALRALYAFLKEKDSSQFWGGLQKVITPDGNILWLCEKHAHSYTASPLQLNTEKSDC
jgi:internalin A